MLCTNAAVMPLILHEGVFKFNCDGKITLKVAPEFNAFVLLILNV